MADLETLQARETAAALGMAVGLLFAAVGGTRWVVALVQQRRAKRAERAELEHLAQWEYEVTGHRWVNPRAWMARR